MAQSKIAKILSILTVTTIGGCGSESSGNSTTVLEQNLATAEKMIDAFYSFDPERLGTILTHAKSAKAILYYQGWAEGGNYKVLERAACAEGADKKISCPITVQDDPVMALKTGFNVTDTFTLTFDGTRLIDVETSSNDQPIYYEARRWVAENMPEVMSGPCLKDEDGGGQTPGDCARAMTEGYRQFMLAQDGSMASESAEAPDLTSATPFIPDDFQPPVLVETETFKLVPLGPELVEIDYAAYMSSIEHLQQTFTRSTSWPTATISAEDAMQDMLNEERRFTNRESFAYAVLTPDGSRERGCVYVRPSSKPGHQAVVRLWVTKAEYDAGFDEELYAWTTQWIDSEWPFQRVAYPGRAISWEAWGAI